MQRRNGGGDGSGAVNGGEGEGRGSRTGAGSVGWAADGSKARDERSSKGLHEGPANTIRTGFSRTHSRYQVQRTDAAVLDDDIALVVHHAVRDGGDDSEDYTAHGETSSSPSDTYETMFEDVTAAAQPAALDTLTSPAADVVIGKTSTPGSAVLEEATE